MNQFPSSFLLPSYLILVFGSWFIDEVSLACEVFLELVKRALFLAGENELEFPMKMLDPGEKYWTKVTLTLTQRRLAVYKPMVDTAIIQFDFNKVTSLTSTFNELPCSFSITLSNGITMKFLASSDKDFDRFVAELGKKIPNEKIFGMSSVISLH